MARPSRLCPEPDDFAASTTGAMLPFLPTLAVAGCLALAALCWESAAPVPATSGPAVTTATASVPRMARMADAGPAASEPPAAEAPHRVPGAVAFATQFPMAGEAALVARLAPSRASTRVARAHPACTGFRCAEASQTVAATLRRPHAIPAASAGAQPFADMSDVEAVAADDRAVPQDALPFAPAFRTVRETVGQTVGILGSRAAILRGEAVALGGAVTDLVDGLR